MKNWKTTLTGIAAIIIVLAKVMNQVASGEGIALSAEDWAILTLGGASIAAKDNNVTGGTKQQ
jgi:hypothetical protein